MLRRGSALVLAVCVLGACGDGDARAAVGARGEPAQGGAAAEAPAAPALDTVSGAETLPAEGAGVPEPAGADGGAEPLPRAEPVSAAPGPRTAGGSAASEDTPAPPAEPGESLDQSGSVEPAEEAAQDASPEEILRATSRAYEGLRSFSARFEQRLENTLLGRTTTSRGTIYQRQPDRFLMAFSDPDGDLIVSDGEWFWMYFPSVDRRQVIRTERGAQGLDLHAQFIGDPVRRFETTYHGMDEVRDRPAHVMTLDPRQTTGYERLKVWIDAEDHLVRRFELTEPNGNVRHFELWDLSRNPSLSDDLFEFTPPADAQVVTR